MRTLTTTITITTSAHVGLLTIRVQRRAGRSVIVEAAGHIPYAPRSVPAPEGWARVILVQTIAGPLAGDRTTIEIEVDEGAKLELTTNAATLAYPASEPAHHELNARVRANARFAWIPGPLVLSEDCNLVSTVDIDLGERAATLTHEIVTLGRHGEQAGAYRSRLRCESLGKPLLHDVVDLDAAGSAGASLVGLRGNKAFASLTLVGIDPPVECGPGELDLSCPGRVLRALAADTASLKTATGPIEAIYRSALAG